MLHIHSYFYKHLIDKYEKNEDVWEGRTVNEWRRVVFETRKKERMVRLKKFFFLSERKFDALNVTSINQCISQYTLQTHSATHKKFRFYSKTNPTEIEAETNYYWHDLFVIRTLTSGTIKNHCEQMQFPSLASY